MACRQPYRVSRGSFPIYEDENYTNRLGEVKVGALYALLRDRLIDERRTRRTLASVDIDIARLEHEAVAIGVQRQAVDAYRNRRVRAPCRCAGPDRVRPG